MNTRKIVVRALQKTGMNRLAHKVYYNYVHGFDSATPAIPGALERSFGKAVDLGVAHDGDYFEFGVFKGYSFWHAQKTARELGLRKMRFFGFDSFAGLPPVEGLDQTDNDDFYEGQYACSRERVAQNLDSKGVDWERTFLIKGFYSESLKESLKAEHEMRKAAIALVDCDLYESTVDVLNFLGSLLQDQTILMMDDWNCFDADDERGQRRALREFLQRNPQWRVEDLFGYGTWGQVFVVRRAGA